MLFSKDSDSDKSRDNKDTKNYKFNSLRAFDWDSASNGLSRYRQVFDRWELKYLGAELSFYNKKFDEADWKTNIEFKAWNLKEGEKDTVKCTINEEFTISKDENTVYITKGWGDDELGKFWRKGDYLWEASIDGDKVGEIKFYIEEHGIHEEGINEYFDVVSLKLYEGADELVPENDREYLKKFDTSKTRYIWAEFRFANQIREDWLSEFFFNFYDESRELIGRIPSKQYIIEETPGDSIFTINQGWGNKSYNNWLPDNYILEVEFQEAIVASVAFSVGNEVKPDVSPDIRDEKEMKSSEEDTGSYRGPKTESDMPVEEKEKIEAAKKKEQLKAALKELDELVGLPTVKEQIREHIAYLDFLRMRKEMGIEEEEKINLHSVFTGNPGTGKTTVVKLLGKIYNAMGLLSKGHVHLVESNDLVSGYVRQSGGQTKEEIKKARGGVLFVDEAYMLYRKGVENDFGQEAIAALITEMSDGPGDIAIMVAGYPAETMEMINSNPGLKSRFKHYFDFEDFSPGELMKIADYAAKKKKVKLSSEAKKTFELELMRLYRKRDKTFGNARLVHSLVADAKINMGVRVMEEREKTEISQEAITTIQKEDIEEVFKEKKKTYIDIPTDEELLAVTLKEFDQLTGLETIKQDVRDMIKLVRYYREIGKDVRNAFPVHSIFKGNPGTGKTTVARILGNIYKSLGILERGHLVETDSSDLIAGYIGQSALKTRERITEAMGGLLFIDEAYSLTEGHNPQFGKKAVATIIKQMEDKRGEFGIIVAGYPDPMDQFLESNPGIQSRFEQTFHFRDFSSEELFTIAENMFAAADLTLDKEAAGHLKQYLDYLYQIRNKFFGNARSVRKIVEKTIRRQNLRMALLSPDERTPEMAGTVTMADLKNFTYETKVKGKRLGFKYSQ